MGGDDSQKLRERWAKILRDKESHSVSGFLHAGSNQPFSLQYRGKLDLACQRRYPLLSAVPRKWLLGDLNHPEALQNLDIAGYCAPVAFQFLRQNADRCWCPRDLLEQKHTLLR